MEQLTRNEKKVLKFLIENARITDTEIAKKLNITPQAVGKIRKKLENSGIIEGYTAKINYEKIGINVFAIGLFKFVPEVWKELKGKDIEEDINKRIKGEHIIGFYRVPEGDVTHIVIYGFRNLDELDSYFHKLQTERGYISELRKLYILSSKSIKKDSPKDLILKILNE